MLEHSIDPMAVSAVGSQSNVNRRGRYPPGLRGYGVAQGEQRRDGKPRPHVI
ncbi:MAG TPA: hypothetical protein VER98_18275 [Terriglobia bacterium]|nr:hypothetical protein [Terriglobia bacterium]